MRAAFLLGLRLTGAGAGPARFRGATVALATTLGTFVLLGLAAVARAERHLLLTQRSTGLAWLLVAVVLSVALPVLVLAATAGRLSAELRDRRLANLRLLGLSPAQTRLVALTEAGAAALVGTLVGLVAFLVLRPTLTAVHPAGRVYTTAELAPAWPDYALVLVTVPLLVVALAALPHRLDAASVLARAHRAEARRPSLWRFAPLLVGLSLCGYVLASDGQSGHRVIVAFLAGVTLTGLGLLAVTPVLVHLVAGALVRRRSPLTTIAGRQLQAQPAGVTRVVSALLIGLFLVTGARAVVVAFESTPQYVQADRQLASGQRVVVNTTQQDADRLVSEATAVDGVRRTVALPRLVGGKSCRSGSELCLEAVVGTCAQLHQAAPTLTGCVDGRPLWLDTWSRERAPSGTVTWFAATLDARPRVPVARFEAPPRWDAVHGDAYEAMAPLDAMVLVPPSAVDRLPADTATDVLVLGPPGRGLADAIEQTGGGAYGFAAYDFADYDFVAGLRVLVWGVAAVILSIGLLSFGITAVDRAIARRREVVGLQLIGVSPGLLRRTQCVEAALPICLGTLLAIALGLVCGATYLSFSDGPVHLPWAQSLTLAAVSLVAAAVIAGLSVLTANPRLRPELIRSE